MVSDPSQLASLALSHFLFLLLIGFISWLSCHGRSKE